MNAWIKSFILFLHFVSDYLLRLRHVLCLRVRDADVAFILYWAGRVGSCIRVSSGRAGGLVAHAL